MQRLRRILFCLAFGLALAGARDTAAAPPEILQISPTSGPEATRVEISGENLQGATAVFFGRSPAVFKQISAEKLVAIVPQRTSTSLIHVATSRGQATSPFEFAVLSDPRVPDEVKFRAGYVNADPRPAGFTSVLLWGIAIADTRVAGYENATIEVAWTQLSCRADGKDFILNDDKGSVRGGLYRRNPWFGINDHEPMTIENHNEAAMLRVGRRADKVWHFWSASPRAVLPPGKLEGCTVKARVKISPGALVQMGMDYWKNPTMEYAPGGSHEAGCSNWYFPSQSWQEAVFTDMGGPEF